MWLCSTLQFYIPKNCRLFTVIIEHYRNEYRIFIVNNFKHKIKI